MPTFSGIVNPKRLISNVSIPSFTLNSSSIETGSFPFAPMAPNII